MQNVIVIRHNIRAKAEWIGWFVLCISSIGMIIFFTLNGFITSNEAWRIGSSALMVVLFILCALLFIKALTERVWVFSKIWIQNDLLSQSLFGITIQIDLLSNFHTRYIFLGCYSNVYEHKYQMVELQQGNHQIRLYPSCLVVSPEAELPRSLKTLLGNRI